MKSRDTEFEVECSICGRSFKYQVNSEDLKNFKTYGIMQMEMNNMELFPYLEDDDINLIITEICNNCV